MTDLPHTELIELQPEPGWLTIWLNRPQVRNALSDDMVAELRAVLDAVRPDRGLRGLTIRGRGGVFCAGGDLQGFQSRFQAGQIDPQQVATASRQAGDLFDQLNRLPQVVVMLVEGAAIAGGLGMLCAADFVAVTRSAQFALTETTLGIPPAQIAPFVAQRIGLPAARRVMLTAMRFDGEAAQELGLADEVVDDADGLNLVEERIRKQVGRCGPGANAATKEILLATAELDRESLKELAAQRFAAGMLGDEGREGIAAFMEKRKPRWST